MSVWDRIQNHLGEEEPSDKFSSDNRGITRREVLLGGAATLTSATVATNVLRRQGQGEYDAVDFVDDFDDDIEKIEEVELAYEDEILEIKANDHVSVTVYDFEDQSPKKTSMSGDDSYSFEIKGDAYVAVDTNNDDIYDSSAIVTGDGEIREYDGRLIERYTDI